MIIIVDWCTKRNKNRKHSFVAQQKTFLQDEQKQQKPINFFSFSSFDIFLLVCFVALSKEADRQTLSWAFGFFAWWCLLFWLEKKRSRLKHEHKYWQYVVHKTMQYRQIFVPSLALLLRFLTRWKLFDGFAPKRSFLIWRQY